MNAVIIEPFLIEQYDQTLALWQRCSGIGISGADSRENIAGYLERNPNMSFLASVGQKVVGSILSGHDGRRGYVHHLAVDDDFRRRGIGRNLVSHSLAALAAVGIQKCHLFVFHENKEGIAFWQANGWTLREDVKIMSRKLNNEEM